MHRSKYHSPQASTPAVAAPIYRARQGSARSSSIRALVHAICNVVAIGAGSIGVLGATAAQAIELRAEEAAFDIPAQPVATALMQFSRQANVQVIADAGMLGDARSQSLNGRFKPAVAISILLQGTGLHYEATASNTVNVVPSPGVLSTWMLPPRASTMVRVM